MQRRGCRPRPWAGVTVVGLTLGGGSQRARSFCVRLCARQAFRGGREGDGPESVGLRGWGHLWRRKGSRARGGKNRRWWAPSEAARAWELPILGDSEGAT